MPSWSIHTAHVEALLSGNRAQDLGIHDANTFLFGNYVPDIYLGFMVSDTTYRLDYCLTHVARPAVIPVPDADRFWDECIWHKVRRPSTPEGMSLALGAWSHLVADRVYNGRFRAFCKGHDVPKGDALRVGKQADFKLFGQSLEISSCVDVTPGLLEAARGFRQYSILPGDVRRAVEVASAITREPAAKADPADYQLLGRDWMQDTFAACDREVAAWLQTWVHLRAEGADCSAADIRNRLDLPDGGAPGGPR